MQVGGSLGTAVLGAVMSNTVDSGLKGNWQDAGLPGTPPPGLDKATATGSVPRQIAQAPGVDQGALGRITDVMHDTFMSGMGVAFTVAGVVGVIAAVVATLTKRGVNVEAGAGAAHI
ncbi:hypothetical protein [Streptomyces aureocirculatus]|uniref:hypothetical protein n=1 Tax=Streptomyces aureocirculatus TaxID=67275 RepID=UPI0006915BE8